jgi:hypothetical protein
MLAMEAFSCCHEQVIPALINWRDPIVQHGLRHKIKYVRLVRRRASSPHAQGADHDGNRYYVQLVLEGHAFIKPKHEEVGTDTIGLDIGPSTLAIVSRNGKTDLLTFCEELAPTIKNKRRLQRKMDRSRRATNPDQDAREGPCEETRQGSLALEGKQKVSGDQATTRQRRTQTGRSPQESARVSGSSHRPNRSNHHHRKDLIQRLAKTVWPKHRISRTRAVCSAFDPHSCKNWRHPERASLLSKPN